MAGPLRPYPNFHPGSSEFDGTRVPLWIWFETKPAGAERSGATAMLFDAVVVALLFKQN